MIRKTVPIAKEDLYICDEYLGCSKADDCEYGYTVSMHCRYRIGPPALRPYYKMGCTHGCYAEIKLIPYEG